MDTRWEFKVGDVVHICNNYGIYLGKHKITELDERLGKPYYNYEGNETPWCSISEVSVSKDPEYILYLMWNRLIYWRNEQKLEDC